MGLLRNYEVVNPFISSSNDAFNRLKPGYEAPVCIVTALGADPATPSRNRTVLAGLVRDVDTPRATRFELRSPNPYTNTYVAVSACIMAMLDGIRWTLESGTSPADLLAEISKEPARPAGTWSRPARTAARRTCSSITPRTSVTVSSVCLRPPCGKHAHAGPAARSPPRASRRGHAHTPRHPGIPVSRTRTLEA